MILSVNTIIMVYAVSQMRSARENIVRIGRIVRNVKKGQGVSTRIKKKGVRMEINKVTVRWWDGYMEEFEATEVRFGCDLLFLRLVGGKNRQIPLRGVRWFGMSTESHQNCHLVKEGGYIEMCFKVSRSKKSNCSLDM